MDECIPGHPCEQLCVNDEGSFHCECLSNYTLATDNKSCKGRGGVTTSHAKVGGGVIIINISSTTSLADTLSRGGVLQRWYTISRGRVTTSPAKVECSHL